MHSPRTAIADMPHTQQTAAGYLCAKHPYCPLTTPYHTSLPPYLSLTIHTLLYLTTQIVDAAASLELGDDEIERMRHLFAEEDLNKVG